MSPLPKQFEYLWLQALAVKHGINARRSKAVLLEALQKKGVDTTWPPAEMHGFKLPGDKLTTQQWLLIQRMRSYIGREVRTEQNDEEEN